MSVWTILGIGVMAAAGIFGLCLARISGVCERRRERWQTERESVVRQ